MIACYFDTGLVLKLVVKEPLSVKVHEFLNARRCRTLDLLHIATAEPCGAYEFVTGDARQAKAARFCGLDVVEIR
ncbi:MAG: hypothetical protein ACKOHM_12615 [Spartobacteria bacterium]